MGDLDPFTTKVGDIYDRDGRRIATVRSTKVPEATTSFLTYGVIIAIPILLIVGLIAGVVLFGNSAVNLIQHGVFTPDRTAALINEAGGPGPYFAAAEKELNSGMVTVSADDADEITATFTITNSGSRSHTFYAAVLVDFDTVTLPSIGYDPEGGSYTGVETDWQIRGSNYRDPIELPPGKRMKLTLTSLDAPSVWYSYGDTPSSGGTSLAARVENVRNARVEFSEIDGIKNPSWTPAG